MDGKMLGADTGVVSFLRQAQPVACSSPDACEMEVARPNVQRGCLPRRTCARAREQQEEELPINHKDCTALGTASSTQGGFQLAVALLDVGQRSYKPVLRSRRIALKVPDAEPEDLASAAWLDQVSAWCMDECLALVHTYIRSGCIQIVLEVIAADVGAVPEGQASGAAVAQALIATGHTSVGAVPAHVPAPLAPARMAEAVAAARTRALELSVRQLVQTLGPDLYRGRAIVVQQGHAPVVLVTDGTDVMPLLPPPPAASAMADQSHQQPRGVTPSSSSSSSGPAVPFTSCTPPDLTVISPMIAYVPSGTLLLYAAGHALRPPEDVQCCARFQGAYLPCQAMLYDEAADGSALAPMRARLPAAAAAAAPHAACMAVAVPPGAEGLLFVEAQRGCLLGMPRPVLLLGNAQEAAEIGNLEAQLLLGAHGASQESVEAFMADYGRWLEFCAAVRTRAPAHSPQGPQQPPACPAQQQPWAGVGMRQQAADGHDSPQGRSQPTSPPACVEAATSLACDSPSPCSAHPASGLKDLDNALATEGHVACSLSPPCRATGATVRSSSGKVGSTTAVAGGGVEGEAAQARQAAGGGDSAGSGAVMAATGAALDTPSPTATTTATTTVNVTIINTNAAATTAVAAPGTHATPAAAVLPAGGWSGLAAPRMARLAVRLLTFAVDRGWVATARRTLHDARAVCQLCLAQVEAEVRSVEGQSLAHLAVRSGSVAMVQELLTWGSCYGHAWDWAAPGPWRLTPLHLAAVLADAGGVARHLLQHLGPAGARLWLTSPSADGSTPAHLAARAGLHALNDAAVRMAAAGSLPYDMRTAHNVPAPPGGTPSAATSAVTSGEASAVASVGADLTAGLQHALLAEATAARAVTGGSSEAGGVSLWADSATMLPQGMATAQGHAAPSVLLQLPSAATASPPSAPLNTGRSADGLPAAAFIRRLDQHRQQQQQPGLAPTSNDSAFGRRGMLLRSNSQAVSTASLHPGSGSTVGSVSAPPPIFSLALNGDVLTTYGQTPGSQPTSSGPVTTPGHWEVTGSNPSSGAASQEVGGNRDTSPALGLLPLGSSAAALQRLLVFQDMDGSASATLMGSQRLSHPLGAHTPPSPPPYSETDIQMLLLQQVCAVAEGRETMPLGASTDSISPAHWDPSLYNTTHKSAGLLGITPCAANTSTGVLPALYAPGPEAALPKASSSAACGGGGGAATSAASATSAQPSSPTPSSVQLEGASGSSGGQAVREATPIPVGSGRAVRAAPDAPCIVPQYGQSHGPHVVAAVHGVAAVQDGTEAELQMVAVQDVAAVQGVLQVAGNSPLLLTPAQQASGSPPSARLISTAPTGVPPRSHAARLMHFLGAAFTGGSNRHGTSGVEEARSQPGISPISTQHLYARSARPEPEAEQQGRPCAMLDSMGPGVRPASTSHAVQGTAAPTAAAISSAAAGAAASVVGASSSLSGGGSPASSAAPQPLGVAMEADTWPSAGRVSAHAPAVCGSPPASRDPSAVARPPARINIHDSTSASSSAGCGDGGAAFAHSLLRPSLRIAVLDVQPTLGGELEHLASNESLHGVGGIAPRCTSPASSHTDSTPANSRPNTGCSCGVAGGNSCVCPECARLCPALLLSSVGGVLLCEPRCATPPAGGAAAAVGVTPADAVPLAPIILPGVSVSARSEQAHAAPPVVAASGPSVLGAAGAGQPQGTMWAVVQRASGLTATCWRGFPAPQQEQQYQLYRAGWLAGLDAVQATTALLLTTSLLLRAAVPFSALWPHLLLLALRVSPVAFAALATPRVHACAREATAALVQAVRLVCMPALAASVRGVSPAYHALFCFLAERPTLDVARPHALALLCLLWGWAELLRLAHTLTATQPAAPTAWLSHQVWGHLGAQAALLLACLTVDAWLRRSFLQAAAHQVRQQAQQVVAPGVPPVSTAATGSTAAPAGL